MAVTEYTWQLPKVTVTVMSLPWLVLRAAAHLPLSAIAIEEPRHAFIIAAALSSN
jgi:hypothetical protein